MKPAVKYALMGAGGLVLMFGSFVVFAALSGQPLHEVAILNKFVKAPDSPGGEETHEPAKAPVAAQPETAGSEHPAGETAKTVDKEEQHAVEKAVGALGLFSLPSPFTADELTDLQHELSKATQGAKSRLAKIEQRERALDDREHDLDLREKELTGMQKVLTDKESELRMLSDEVNRDSEARKALDAESWKQISKFFEEGEPAELSDKLLKFEPKEAAKILHSLDDERAGALVNALPAASYKDYLDAFREQSVKNAGKKKP